MANRINNRRYNKLLSYRNNYYSDGGFYIPDNLLSVGNLDSLGKDNLSYDNYKLPSLDIINNSNVISKVIPNLEFDNNSNNSFLSKVKGLFNEGSLNGAATAVGGMVEGAIGGGMSSSVGNAIGGLSNIASAIPGPWGAVAGAGLKVIGGLTNRAFGSKMNEGNIAEVNSDINRLNNFQSNASSFDTLANTWGTTKLGNNFSNSYIGKDGWFSSKAKNKAKQLRNKLRIVNNFTLNSLQNNADNITNDTMNNLEANYAALGGFLNQYANGGSIHINPENRGKFNATKKRTGKTTEELTHSKNPLTRKRAIFAQNAAKWHHAFGGELNTNGGDFSTGLMFIDEGGTHESNPYEGVPMGMDAEGTPNLVEQGEVIFNDYVFSNRMFADGDLLESFNLPKSYDGYSFAAIAEKLGEESKERPNDPISKRGLLSSMSRLQQAQETVRQQNQVGQEGVQYAHGGRMGTLFDGLGDMPNFLDGVDYGDWQDYGTLLEPINAEDLWNESMVGADEGDKGNNNSKLTWLRYAPVVGAAIGLGQNLFSKPDYTSADAILEAANQAGNYTPVGYTPIGNYLQYRPFDRNFYLNKLNAQAGATRRAIMNTASPSRNAALLAADYNAQGRLGDLARQAEEYNLAQRQAVETFNRGTNMANAEMGLKAAMANQEAALKARSSRLSGVAQAMAVRDAVDARRGASMSANLTNFFNSLGDIGREEIMKAWINENPALYYAISTGGAGTPYKGKKKEDKKAKGGYLTIKSKRK